MGKFRGSREAFGKPGIDPRWSHGNKEGAGTAYSADSPVWFTLWNGVVTEIYYPTIDRPQIRDLQYLVSDGKTFMHEEKRDLVSKTEIFSEHAPGYRIVNTDRDHGFRIVKEVIVAPHLACLVQHTRLEEDGDLPADLRLYVLCAPHLEGGGWGNNAYVVEMVGREILVAEKGGIWLALAATLPFNRLSCGYVGESDGWTDLHENYQMDWEFDRAPTAMSRSPGSSTDRVGASSRSGWRLEMVCNAPSPRFFSRWVSRSTITRPDTIEQWGGHAGNLAVGKGSPGRRQAIPRQLQPASGARGQDYPGAFIASLSIPWGEAKGDEDTGGYHLVWTRDMVNSATGLLAAGNKRRRCGR